MRRRLKLSDPTDAMYEYGAPGGPYPVIEVDDQTGEIHVARTIVNPLPSYVKMTLEASQINTLDTIPVKLVTPPNEITSVVPLFLHAYRHYHGGAVFNLQSNDVLRFGDPNAATTVASVSLTGWVDQAASGYYYSDLGYQGYLYPGAALYLYMNTPAPLNGDGHIMVYIQYKLLISPLKHFVDDTLD